MSALDASVQQNISGSGNIFTATGDVFVIQKPDSATDRQVQTNLRILLNKVRTFWVQGVLEKSIHHAVLINLEKEVRTDSVDHPWGMVLELPDNEKHALPPKTDIIEIFNQSARALLILGEPGSGKTTTLLDLARKLIEKAEQDISTEPVPVVFNLSSWGTSKSLFDWLVKELSDKYQIPKKIGKLWLEQNRVLPLLDGFDEIAEAYRQNCVNAINEFIGDYGLPGLVVCSRITEYTKLPVRLKLNAAICVQPLSDKQIDQYLKLALGKDHSLKGLLKKDELLASLAKTPLFLSVLCLAHRSSPEEVKNLSADSSEEYTQKLFDIYFDRILKRKGGKTPYTPEKVQKTLSWLARKMVEQNQSVFYIEHLNPTWLPLLKERFFYYFLSRTSLWFLIGFFGSIGFLSLTTIGISGIIGLLLSVILGSLFGVIGWLSSEESVNNLGVKTLSSNSKKHSIGWGYFIYIQIIIFIFWLIIASRLTPVTFDFLQGYYWDSSLDLLSAMIDSVDLTTSIIILFVLFALETILFVLLWKFGMFLKYILVTSKKIFTIIIFWAISIVIVWLLLNGRTISVPIGIVVFNFLTVSLILRFDSMANFIIMKFGYEERFKQGSKDIRTIENLSWSWKKTLPIITIMIPSLLFFIYTSTFTINDVTLWDSETGEIISNLQKQPSVHWDTFFSNDGRRIMLLGGEPSSVKAYLYDSVDGELITEMGIYQNGVSASFNSDGSRLLIEEGTSECLLWCYDQLWNAETGKLISILRGDQALKAKDIGDFNLDFGVSWFSNDGNLIISSIELTEKTENLLVRSGYIIWDAETGSPVLFFFYDLTQKFPRFYLGSAFPGNENRLAVEVSQISDLIIYDDTILKQHPLIIRNFNSNGSSTCYWYVKSQNVDCASPKSSIDLWEPYIFSLDNLYNMFSIDFDSGLVAAMDAGQLTDAVRDAFQNDGNPLTTDASIEVEQTGSRWVIDDDAGTRYHNQYLIRKDEKTLNVYYISSWNLSPFSYYSPIVYMYSYSYNNYEKYESKLALGIKDIEYGGVELPVDVYPSSRVFVKENPTLPQLITITGDNPLRYGFGFLSVFTIVVLIVIGLKTNLIENKALPNQGILLSARNSLILGEIAIIVFGLITSVIYAYQWMYILGFGLLAGTFIWVLYGGMGIVYHYTLRFILARRGYLPWQLVPFLDYCADNLLLQKVGGGYIFIHRMLLENLANKTEK